MSTSHIVNSRSDRGLTLIEEKFIGKRRLEVYEWSISSLERLANSIISSSKSSWAKLPERTIDYYRQWGTPRVLRDGDHLGKLRRLFSKTLAKEITIDRLSIQAQYFAWTAELWLALGKSEEGIDRRAAMSEFGGPGLGNGARRVVPATEISRTRVASRRNFQGSSRPDRAKERSL